MKNSKIKIFKMIKTAKKHTAIMLFLILGCITCFLADVTAVYAGPADAKESAGYFLIDAQLMPSDGSTYDVRLTVQNNGEEDWGGTVRLLVEGKYGSYMDCVYDTPISLPQGSVKQFAVKIPMETYGYGSDTNGNMRVALIGNNSKVADEKVFNKFLAEDIDALTMGILSDNYSALTYLDMGGEKIDFYSGEYPIKLKELSQGNLIDSLELLTFLVIDKYDTGILTDDEISAIEEWNENGGVLIVGTGEYAKETLGGLDYLNITCRKTDGPGTYTYSQNDYDYVDWSKLSMAELIDKNGEYYKEEDVLALLCSKYGSSDYGAVGILPYSLTELGKLDTSDFPSYSSRTRFIQIILEQTSVWTGARYDSANSSKVDDTYMKQRMLSKLGSSGNILSFGTLKFIMVVYVILVGPVSYLILRGLKKRDLYWAIVPVASLVGVVIVFFAGRGFQVVSARVYSVSVYDLAENGVCNTYMHCYDAGHREWSLRLAEDYEYAGAQMSYSSYDEENDNYKYRISREDDRMRLGIKPHSGFEDAYFVAAKKTENLERNSAIGWEHGFDYDGSYCVVSVTNNTNYDFKYFAIVSQDSVTVYKGLAAGETALPDGKKPIFKSTIYSYSGYSDYINKAIEMKKTEDVDALAALGMGIISARAKNTEVIVGVVDNWDKAVDDNCNEVSYGCFYIINDYISVP